VTNENDKKKIFDYRTKVSNDMANLYLNPDSALHCEQCHERMGIMRILRRSLFKKPGVLYIVVCKACGHENVRYKGAYKKEIEEHWSELERQVREQRKQP
jgi:hypothetical protein